MWRIKYNTDLGRKCWYNGGADISTALLMGRKNKTLHVLVEIIRSYGKKNINLAIRGFLNNTDMYMDMVHVFSAPYVLYISKFTDIQYKKDPDMDKIAAAVSEYSGKKIKTSAKLPDRTFIGNLNGKVTHIKLDIMPEFIRPAAKIICKTLGVNYNPLIVIE